MTKRTLMALASLLAAYSVAAAQNDPAQPGTAPGAVQPSGGGGALQPATGGGPAQPGGQPSLPGGAGGKKKGGAALFPGAGGTQPGAGPTGGAGQAAPGAGAPGTGAPSGMMGGFAFPKKDKELKEMTLEELLAKALKDNPDIRVAESKVREAEANLNRARLEVLQKVARLQQEILLARTMLSAAADSYGLIARLGAAVSQKEKGDAVLMLERAKGELAKLEAELPYLVGKQPAAMTGMGGAAGGGPGMAPSGAGAFAPLQAQSVLLDYPRAEFAVTVGDFKNVPGTVSDKLRKALDTEVTLRQGDMTLHEAVSFLTDKMQGINVHISDKKLNQAKVNMYFRVPVTLGAIFQFFEDELDCKCVIREYGIVIAQRDRVPPGAAPLLEFWKKSRSAESKSK